MSDINRHEPAKRMSKVAVHNGTVYLSGVVGNPDGDVAQQTRDCLVEVERRLALAGTDKTRILQAQIWLADIATDFAAMNAVWDAWVPEGHAPTRAAGEAKLARPELLVEIIITAAAQ